jgi:hypothetical protein
VSHAQRLRHSPRPGCGGRRQRPARRRPGVGTGLGTDTGHCRFAGRPGAAVVAAENAKEPGAQRPEERVIPQLSVPLQSRRNAALAAAAASAPPGSVPGAVNDGAARCLAARSASERAACERGLPASAPVKPTR